MSSGLTTTTRRTCRSRILAISHAAPVTSNATRSSRPRLCANSSSTSGEVLIRPAERTRPASQIATSQKSRCTSNPIALPTDLLTTNLLASMDRRENQRANDNDRYVLAAQPGQVAGAANKDQPALEAHRPNRPARLRSPRKPLSQVTRPYGQDRTATFRARFSCPDPHERRRPARTRLLPPGESGRPHFRAGCSCRSSRAGVSWASAETTASRRGCCGKCRWSGGFTRAVAVLTGVSRGQRRWSQQRCGPRPDPHGPRSWWLPGRERRPPPSSRRASRWADLA